MRMNKFLAFFVLMILIFNLESCVQDDDFSIPESLGQEENLGLEAVLEGLENGSLNLTTINHLKALYGSGESAIEIETDIVLKGYVSSSDYFGNFYKELYLQDAFQNPTQGIHLMLEQPDSYNKFNMGREVYILLKGLYIGEARVGNGVISIGGTIETTDFGTNVDNMSINQIKASMFRSEISENILPLDISFSQISNAHIGMLVKVNGVEFADDLAGETYFDPVQSYDTKRIMQSCEGFEYTNFILETSGFSSFKDELLPINNGSISGIITKDFLGDTIIMVLNSSADVDFNNERCELLDAANYTIIVSENFQSVTHNTNLNLPGWTNFNEVGSRVWRERFREENGYTEFTTFGGSNEVNIGWLVAPSINTNLYPNTFVNFKTAQHHVESDENKIEVFISTDYNGSDVLAATWLSITANLPGKHHTWYEFIDSGMIDISNYSGELHFAFKVTGSGIDENLDGSFQIDDFNVYGKN